MDTVRLLISEINEKLGKPEIELHYSSHWQLLVAVILSAQCTDERVNKVTEILFEKYPNIGDYTELTAEELEKIIYSTGFYKNKSKNIIKAAQHICEKHDCVIPSQMESLVKVPGIGRKTANVLISATEEEPEGIVVDTHVKRVSKRLAMTKHDDPVKIEKDLMALIPKKDWKTISMGVVLFGRYICKSRKPLCDKCGLKDHCLYYEKEKR